MWITNEVFVGDGFGNNKYKGGMVAAATRTYETLHYDCSCAEQDPKAAALCKKAGFDMVMIHAAHGWLFNQFLSPLENKRTDEFGGDLKNRARILMLALDSVRKAVGSGFPVELRLNGDDRTAVKLECSFGGDIFNKNYSSIDHFINYIDGLMYQNKNQKKNKELLLIK